MTEKVLEVKHLSKLYRLGVIGTGRLQQDLRYWWNATVMRKPSLTVPLQNAEQSNGQYIWALKDVNFEVQRGECLGIIGSNGSGKSTLLKIISKIVRPTEGIIRGHGRVSSLLEVGIGFSDDLTGRENIYLNGYIMGLKKQEIKNKFDEIVDFASIDGFIDTPVKRYSSGMYMRLAFAVAAHLEPDLLIVDEVLAVGDEEFQKKCLGKMKEVTESNGRTIIFVSHNMQAVSNLCDRALWLQKGKIKSLGDVPDVVRAYTVGVQEHQFRQAWKSAEEAPGNNHIRFKNVELIPMSEGENNLLTIRMPFVIKFQFWNLDETSMLTARLQVFSSTGDCIFDIPTSPRKCGEGLVAGQCSIPGNFFNDGSYFISILILKNSSEELFYFERCMSFELADFRDEAKWLGTWKGAVRPKFPFELQQVVDVPYTHLR